MGCVVVEARCWIVMLGLEEEKEELLLLLLLVAVLPLLTWPEFSGRRSSCLEQGVGGCEDQLFGPVVGAAIWTVMCREG